MKQEVNPQETSRAKAFELWMKSPMPMVTLTKTFDVTHLYKVSKRRGIKFNVLLCWCIGKTASRIKEFYLLPEKARADEQNSGLSTTKKETSAHATSPIPTIWNSSIPST